MPALPVNKDILAKGKACSTCKARKVRCDAIKPACTACRRSARFRGDDPELVRCCYFEGAKRCSTGGGASKSAPAKRARTARDQDVSYSVNATVNEAPAAPASTLPDQCTAPTVVDALPVPPAPLALPVLPLSLPQALPLPPPPPAFGAFSLPAPIAVKPHTLPDFLSSPTQHTPSKVPYPPAKLKVAAPPPPLADDDLAAFLDDLLAPTSSLPLSYAQPRAPYQADVFSPSSPSSLSSFSFSDASATSSSSSSTSSSVGSPFSLCEDFDLAFGVSASSFSTAPAIPSPPPLFLPTAPASYAHHSAASAAFFDYHARHEALLPTSHDGDQTLALPLWQ
ncbi:hypothetical protein JCM8097_003756 [Rhodosporidiobolus ruineniae]